jgi:ankyrin repeat protein/beta-lactamase regulating signal transducer with metallopeptidase domain
MMGFVISYALFERLAGTLLHFVWEGVAIGAIAALTLRLMRRRSAEWRYAAAAVALLAMAAAPLATFVFYAEIGGFVLTALARLNVAAATAASNVSMSDVALWTRWILFVWTGGVLFCLIRLIGGWLLSRRMVRAATAIVSPAVISAMERAREGLHYFRRVHLRSGAQVETPVVIGWLRPAILLPASAITGLDAEQLLAILAHELAHIRRHDFLINAVQRAVECVLFYHPFVWWISGRIRVERERCCDDLAVQVCSNPLVYAQALIALEKARDAEPTLAVQAAGSGVADRVRRLLGAQNQARDWQPVAAALLLVAILAGAGMWQPPAFASPAARLVLPAPPAQPQVETPRPATPLAAVAAIATAQTGARPAAVPPPSQVTQPPIARSREEAREKLGMLRVDYSADSFVKQAGEGDTIAVKTFLVAGMNINARDAMGFTAVMKAAQMGQTETVQSLLAAGADPNLVVTGGPSALSLAAEKGDLATMKVLLAGGAKVDLRLSSGERALFAAARSGAREAAVLLLDNGAAVDARTDRINYTPLIVAACQGFQRRLDMIRLLLDRGADVNAAASTGESPLFCAAGDLDTERIALLLDRGAEVNKASKSSSIPSRALSPLLRVLVASTDKAKISAAALVLINRGADVNAPSDDPPLIRAVLLGLTEVVRVMLDKGANPNSKTQAMTALTAALGYIKQGPEYEKIVILLIERGADVNLTGEPSGITPLQLAVEAKRADVARMLLGKGADPNRTSSQNGNTPLVIARGNTEITQMLINAGAKQ